MPIDVVEHRYAVCDWCGRRELYSDGSVNGLNEGLPATLQLCLPEWSYGAMYHHSLGAIDVAQVLCPDCASIQHWISNPSTTLGAELREAIHTMIQTHTASYAKPFTQ